MLKTDSACAEKRWSRQRPSIIDVTADALEVSRSVHLPWPGMDQGGAVRAHTHTHSLTHPPTHSLTHSLAQLYTRTETSSQTCDWESPPTCVPTHPTCPPPPAPPHTHTRARKRQEASKSPQMFPGVGRWKERNDILQMCDHDSSAGCLNLLLHQKADSPRKRLQIVS